MTAPERSTRPQGANADEEARGALAARDIDRATGIAEAALAGGAETALILNLVAHRRQLAGRYPEALDLLDRALRLSPGDPFVLNSLGGCHSKSGRPRDALEAFEAALAVRPDFAPAHHGRGLALSSLGDRVAARGAQEMARALDPNFPDPLGALAAMATEDRDFPTARAFAQRALTLDPWEPAAALSLATIEMLEGEHDRVVERTAALLAGGALTLLHQASAQRLGADSLEALGRTTEAMAAYMSANAALRAVYMTGVEEAGIELGVELCARLHQHFVAASPGWALPSAENASADGGARGHVFLVGFPRSGTTLLEQVLASHDEMVTLEERPTLGASVGEFFANSAGLERLATLDGDEVVGQREDYWGRVMEFGVDVRGKVFVDKMPLNTLYLPLIAKLFPRARIILARRDPRDVVVSCFRRRFQPNTLIVEYTDLERTALFYDGAMRLAGLYRQKLPLRFHVHRHEALIEDFDTETRALCDFLDLPWRADLREFAATAMGRDIRTPSAAQVRRGLYREGMAQWRRYQEELRPVLPILTPWVQAFGYPNADGARH